MPWEVCGLSSKLGSKAQNTRAKKRWPHNIRLWKSLGILSVREEWKYTRKTGVLLKGQPTKSHSQPLNLGSGEVREEWTRVTWRETRVCGSGETVEGTATRFPVLLLSDTTDTIFYGWGTLLHMASAYKKSVTPRSGLPVASPQTWVRKNQKSK